MLFFDAWYSSTEILHKKSSKTIWNDLPVVSFFEKRYLLITQQDSPIYGQQQASAVQLHERLLNTSVRVE
jgi:hypothetical protein